MAQTICISNSRPYHPLCNVYIPAPDAHYLANLYQLDTYSPYFQWVSQISMKTLFVSFVSIYFSSSGAICVWKFRNIFQNRRQEMVAHELQCLLCKLPVECRKGATDLLQQHLRRDHEVVRWARVLLGKRKGQVFQVWGRLVASPVSSEQGREGGDHKIALPQVELFAKVFKASHFEVWLFNRIEVNSCQQLLIF